MAARVYSQRPSHRATWHRLISVCGLTVLIVSLQPVTPASAATLAVDRLDDAYTADDCLPLVANDCSLRGAILAANLAPGVDTVVVPAGTYVLTPGDPSDPPDAKGDIPIKNPLTIEGAGPGQTIIDANGAATLSGALKGDIIPGTVTIRNLTISGGGGAGGAIVSRSNLTLSNVVIHGNTSTTHGGGINHAYGALSLAHTTISNNVSAANGGGLFLLSGSLSVENSFIEGNQAGTSNFGGGISLSTQVTSFSISDTVIHENTGGGGGGVTISGGNGSLTRVEVTDNDASSTGGGGGMTVAGTPTVAISDSLFSGNTTAGSGGGAYIGDTANVTIERCTLSGNVSNATVSPGGGGGIFFSNSSLTLTNSTVSGNSAKADGGGLFSYMPGSSAMLTAVTIASNTPDSDGTGGGSGGGLYIYNGTVTLVGSIVADNTGAECYRSAGSLVSSGYNLSSDASCELDGPGDLPSTLAGLGPLADNGGPTQTHALLPGSQAIDASSIVICPTIDQRGFPRPVGAECDIGAYEAGWWVLLPVILRQYP